MPSTVLEISAPAQTPPATRRRLVYFCVIFFVLLFVYFVVNSSKGSRVLHGLDVGSTKVRHRVKSPFALHPSLYSKGRIIIHHPGQYPRGGPAAMNYLHCALVSAGFNAFMFLPISSVIPTSCSRSIDGNFEVTADDVVIIAEVHYTSAVSNWRSKGARVVIYMLGLHVPILDQYHTDVIWAPSSTYTRDLYLATGKQVLFSPPERFIYDEHEKDLKIVNATSKYSYVYSALKSKENLIITDNDSNFPPSLQSALSRLPLTPPVTVKVLLGIPFPDIPSWYRRAKIVIDLGLPGVERINNEGSLFDAIILVGDILNGMDPTDFPIPHQFKLDTRNETQMFEVIKNCLMNYERLIPLWRPLKELSLDLPRRYQNDDVPSFFAARSVKFFLLTSSLDEESAVIPFALHCAVHYPLARIEARVQNLGQFKRNHDMILKILKDIVNLSRDWFLLSERNASDQLSFPNESQYVITIDPRNLIINEQLPNLLVHLLNNQSAIAVPSAVFGAAAQVIGNVTLWQSAAFGKSTPIFLRQVPQNYSHWLEEQLINVYERPKEPDLEMGSQLAAALYKTEEHKLLQSMLPLAVPRFVEVLKDFQKIYPKR